MKLTNEQLKVLSVAFDPEKRLLSEKRLSDVATWMLIEEVLAARELRAAVEPKRREYGQTAQADHWFGVYDKISAWRDE
jgi:hypothetical protein